MRSFVRFLPIFILILGSVWAQGRRDEDSRDYFKRWLQRDVVYIISPEEKAVFKKLDTDDEKEAFIEQFWRSRDPDPATADNEFREEHFRRVAYANEKFHAGEPGWKTDRGMVYIKFGPPDRKQTNPMGGRVYRSQRELAATDRRTAKDAMTALPYEVWEYRYIDGLGPDVGFEFVAKDGTSNYELALSPEDKDALFFNTGSHLPKLRNRNYGLKIYGGNVLDRVEKYASAFKPLPAQPPRTFVSSQVHFDQLPFDVKVVPGREGEDGVVDFTVEIPHRSLSFNSDFGDYVARVDLEVFVRDLTKVVVAHKAESLQTRIRKSEFRQEVKKKSAYRTRFSLPTGRYLFEVWIKDIVGDAASYQRVLAVVPKPDSSIKPQ